MTAPTSSFNLIAALERQRQEALLLMQEEDQRTTSLIALAEAIRAKLSELQAALPEDFEDEEDEDVVDETPRPNGDVVVSPASRGTPMRTTSARRRRELTSPRVDEFDAHTNNVAPSRHSTTRWDQSRVQRLPLRSPTPDRGDDPVAQVSPLAARRGLALLATPTRQGMSDSLGGERDPRGYVSSPPRSALSPSTLGVITSQQVDHPTSVSGGDEGSFRRRTRDGLTSPRPTRSSIRPYAAEARAETPAPPSLQFDASAGLGDADTSTYSSTPAISSRGGDESTQVSQSVLSGYGSPAPDESVWLSPRSSGVGPKLGADTAPGLSNSSKSLLADGVVDSHRESSPDIPTRQSTNRRITSPTFAAADHAASPEARETKLRFESAHEMVTWVIGDLEELESYDYVATFDAVAAASQAMATPRRTVPDTAAASPAAALWTPERGAAAVDGDDVVTPLRFDGTVWSVNTLGFDPAEPILTPAKIAEQMISPKHGTKAAAESESVDLEVHSRAVRSLCRLIVAEATAYADQRLVDRDMRQLANQVASKRHFA